MKTPTAIVLLGLPVSEVDFSTRAQDPLWDWGRQLGVTPTFWRDGFERHADIIKVAEEVIDDARAYGYTIVCRAKLDDLQRALSISPVVVLFAHWQSYTVVETDLLEGWEEHAWQIAKNPRDPVGQLLQVLIEENRLDRRTVTVALNRAIERGELRRWLPAGLADRSVKSGELIERTLARDLVDAALRGRLRQGNRLELFDRLHTLAALEGVIPSDFSGVLDLSCCNSSVPATYIKLCRTKHINIIQSDESLVMPVQMRIVQWALRETHRIGGCYKDIRLECSRQVNEHFHRKKES